MGFASGALAIVAGRAPVGAGAGAVGGRARGRGRGRDRRGRLRGRRIASVLLLRRSLELPDFSREERELVVHGLANEARGPPPRRAEWIFPQSGRWRSCCCCSKRVL